MGHACMGYPKEEVRMFRAGGSVRPVSPIEGFPFDNALPQLVVEEGSFANREQHSAQRPWHAKVADKEHQVGCVDD